MELEVDFLDKTANTIEFALSFLLNGKMFYRTGKSIFCQIPNIHASGLVVLNKEIHIFIFCFENSVTHKRI